MVPTGDLDLPFCFVNGFNSSTRGSKGALGDANKV